MMAISKLILSLVRVIMDAILLSQIISDTVMEKEIVEIVPMSSQCPWQGVGYIAS